MASEWPIVRLGDYVDSSLGKMLDAKKNKGILQPYLGNSNVRWGTFDLSDLSQMRFEEHEEDRYGIRNGDLIVCEGGEPGRAAIWREEVPNMKIQKALHRIRTKEGLNNYYLFYWFMLAARVGQLEPYFTGTTIKHLTGKALSALELPLPPIAVQEEVARILKSLDDKIELNRRMNETLEAMARAIFKSWFVDFDPVRAKASGEPPESICRRLGLTPDLLALFPDRLVDSELGEIPEGWATATVGEIADVIDCLHAKKPDRCDIGRPFLQLNNIRDDGLLDMKDTYFVNEGDYLKWTSRMEAKQGDCVITNVGRVGAVAQIPEDLKAALGRNMTGIRCKPTFPYPTFLIQALLSDSMRAEIERKMDVGTILNALNVKSIPKLRFVFAGEKLLAQFELVCRPLRQRMEHGLLESSTLATLRDGLLPRLLSGELRVGSSGVDERCSAESMIH